LNMPDDMLRLAPAPGSRVVVAGGCGDFGRPVVAAALASDLRVAVLDLPQSLALHPPDPAVVARPIDATDPEAVASAFTALDAQWGGIDVLVFLVGFTLTPPPRLDDVTAAAWDDVLAGNLRSAFLCTQAALPLLRRDGGGAIVTVSSGLGYNLLPGFGPYGAAKAGLVALTKALAIENAPDIRANAVAPSAAHTAFMSGGTGRGPETGGDDWFTAGAAKGASTGVPPMGRLCEPEDVVGPVMFLAGPASGFMTGQVLHVNGGRLTP
jgi:NAD(P)-dependent dehydrogenase (short-subunit alcohol dehydrogenase family)